MVLGSILDGNKNSNSTKFRGEFTMCSNPYNLIVFPNSLAFPFLHRQQFKKWVFMKINISYTMKKRSGMNLTLPGARLLMNLRGQHSPHKSYRQSLPIPSLLYNRNLREFSSLTFNTQLHYHHPIPTRFLRTSRAPLPHMVQNGRIVHLFSK